MADPPLSAPPRTSLSLLHQSHAGVGIGLSLALPPKGRRTEKGRKGRGGGGGRDGWRRRLKPSRRRLALSPTPIVCTGCSLGEPPRTSRCFPPFTDTAGATCLSLLPPALSLLHPLYAKQRREIHSSPFSLPLPLSLRRRWLGRKREAHSNINQLERRRAGKRTGERSQRFHKWIAGHLL